MNHADIFKSNRNQYSLYSKVLYFQAITREQGQELADEFGMKFLETSAKANINVEEAFFTLARFVIIINLNFENFLLRNLNVYYLSQGC